MSHTTELRNFPKGHRLGPYEIASFIGAGGMGQVFRARDTRLGFFAVALRRRRCR